jgi:hypothetical protein
VDRPGRCAHRSHLADYIHITLLPKKLDIAEIRRLYLEEDLSAAQIGEKFGVSKQMILARLRACGVNRAVRKGRTKDNFRYPGVEGEGIEPLSATVPLICSIQTFPKPTQKISYYFNLLFILRIIGKVDLFADENSSGRKVSSYDLKDISLVVWLAIILGGPIVFGLYAVAQKKEEEERMKRLLIVPLEYKIKEKEKRIEDEIHERYHLQREIKERNEEIERLKAREEFLTKKEQTPAEPTLPSKPKGVMDGNDL